MSTRIGDFRSYTRLESQLMAQFDAKLLAMRKDLDASLAAQAALISELAARPSLVELGSVSITVGSTLAITTAGATRQVVPFAGSARPTAFGRCPTSIYRSATGCLRSHAATPVSLRSASPSRHWPSGPRKRSPSQSVR